MPVDKQRLTNQMPRSALWMQQRFLGLSLDERHHKLDLVTPLAGRAQATTNGYFCWWSAPNAL